MAEQKVTNEQRDEIARRFKAGEVMSKLATEYGICKATVKKICDQRHATRPKLARGPGGRIRNLTEFSQRVRSILWRQDVGKEKLTYNAWQARVAILESPDGGGYTKNQAIVRASKEYPCLYRLFREYDVSEFDPNPDSHPAIKHQAPAGASQQPAAFGEIACEGRDQSYRDNLNWAINAAGEFLRTGVMPLACPNDAAYYLFMQAHEQPKDFLTRLGQIESKGDGGEEQRLSRKAGQRGLAEIDGMLAELTVEDADGS